MNIWTQCSEYNSELWNTNTKENQDIARKQKRNLFYISNILVVKDPAKPENDGKVFLYRYGKKVFDKINELLTPDETLGDEEPINVFDLWEGANFRLSIRKVENFRNYDKSKFDSQSEVFEGDDDAKEELWKKEYPLQPFLDPSEFKSYDELKTRLDKVLGLSGGTKSNSTQKKTLAEELEDEIPFDVKEEKAVSRTRKPKEAPKAETSEDDDDMAFFERLKNED